MSPRAWRNAFLAVTPFWTAVADVIDSFRDQIATVRTALNCIERGDQQQYREDAEAALDSLAAGVWLSREEAEAVLRALDAAGPAWVPNRLAERVAARLSEAAE